MDVDEVAEHGLDFFFCEDSGQAVWFFGLGGTQRFCDGLVEYRIEEEQEGAAGLISVLLSAGVLGGGG